MPSNSTYNNLLLSNTGPKNLPNLNLVVNGYLRISDGQLINGYSKDIFIKGNWVDNVSTGGFISTAGKVSFNGTALQNITVNGNEKFFNLEINNSGGLTLQSPAEITNNLILTLGKINTTSTNILNLSNSNSNIVTGAGLGTSSFVNGPLNKTIGATGSFTFPVGTGITYGPATISNADADIWQAQYYLGNYNATSFIDPMIEVCSTEYWRIYSATPTKSAIVTLPYGLSGIVSKWVLAEYSNLTSSS